MIIIQYAVTIVFLILSILLIGIPGIFFTSSIFVANFNGNYIEKEHTQALGAQSGNRIYSLNLKKLSLAGVHIHT